MHKNVGRIIALLEGCESADTDAEALRFAGRLQIILGELGGWGIVVVEGVDDEESLNVVNDPTSEE